MQVLQAGSHKLIYLELEPEMIATLAKQAGFETKAKETGRLIQLDLSGIVRLEHRGGLCRVAHRHHEDPIALRIQPRRRQFYVDGRNGAVMQTPIILANKRDRSGRAAANAVRLSITKELPASFRLPGKQPLTEQVFYHLFLNFLRALAETGVAVCGSGSLQPLAGRTESIGSRN